MTVAQELTRMPIERAMRISAAPGEPFPYGGKKKGQAGIKQPHHNKHTYAQEMQKRIDVFDAMAPGKWYHASEIKLNFGEAYIRRMLNDLHSQEKIIIKQVIRKKYFMRPAR
jgi:hypothetical protein